MKQFQDNVSQCKNLMVLNISSTTVDNIIKWVTESEEITEDMWQGKNKTSGGMNLMEVTSQVQEHV